MQTKTLDKIVSDKLIEVGYPIHYYLNFAKFAQSGLQEAGFDINLFSNIKEVKLTISNGRADIPTGCISVISVYGIVAGERRVFFRNNDLASIQKEVNGSPVAWGTESYLPSADQYGTSPILDDTSVAGNISILYPNDVNTYEYDVSLDGTKILFGPRIDVTECYVLYQQDSVSESVANVVHPYLIPYLGAYIDWKLSEKERRAQSETMRKYDTVNNEKRKARARFNSLSIGQLYHLLSTN